MIIFKSHEEFVLMKCTKLVASRTLGQEVRNETANLLDAVIQQISWLVEAMMKRTDQMLKSVLTRHDQARLRGSLLYVYNILGLPTSRSAPNRVRGGRSATEGAPAHQAS